MRKHHLPFDPRIAGEEDEWMAEMQRPTRPPPGEYSWRIAHWRDQVERREPEVPPPTLTDLDQHVSITFQMLEAFLGLVLVIVLCAALLFLCRVLF